MSSCDKHHWRQATAASTNYPKPEFIRVKLPENFRVKIKLPEIKCPKNPKPEFFRAGTSCQATRTRNLSGKLQDTRKSHLHRTRKSEYLLQDTRKSRTLSSQDARKVSAENQGTRNRSSRFASSVCNMSCNFYNVIKTIRSSRSPLGTGLESEIFCSGKVSS